MPTKDKAAYNEYMKNYMKERYYKRKSKALEMLGNKCSECNSIEELEFHHTERTEKITDITDLLSGASEAKFQAEIVKCVLLCKICHKQISDSQKSVGHGEGKSGKRNCPCDLCKARKREYMKERYS